MTFIKCERAHVLLGNTPPQCNNGDVTVRFLKEANINTQNRAYQREKVSTVKWKQDLMRTVLINTYAGIPEIHIRVLDPEQFEVVDGQQRSTGILDFVNGEYSLPENFVVDGMDCSGMNSQELRDTYPSLYERIMNYRISCKWYQELTNLETAHLFINVLNNVNDMKPQEIRNAVLGPYSDYVRDTGRFNPHELFTRITEVKGNTEKEYLKYFSKKFTLGGRMEVDEWLSTLLYMKEKGFRNGITNDLHLKWVQEIQNKGGKYENKYKDKKSSNDLLNFALALMKATPKEFKNNLNPLRSLIMVLYAWDLKNRFSGTINPQKYTKAFWDVYTRWSDTNLGLYKKHTMFEKDDQMPPFSELFGGKNKVAIGTMVKVLDMEFLDNLEEFGVIEWDSKETFSEADIFQKWEEQDGKCFYTGEPLDEDDLHGDHFIPRSWGIKLGGVTEYHNLVVTSRYHNLAKGKMSGEEYIAYLENQKKDAA
tara:strand:+ start:798 stop:2237 length:1440 start_codon:yes stop_codon:yes gene_type:complete